MRRKLPIPLCENPDPADETSENLRVKRNHNSPVKNRVVEILGRFDCLADDKPVC